MRSGPLSEGGGRGSAVGLHFSDDSTLQVRAPYAYSKRPDPDDPGDPISVDDDGNPVICAGPEPFGSWYEVPASDWDDDDFNGLEVSAGSNAVAFLPSPDEIGSDKTFVGSAAIAVPPPYTAAVGSWPFGSDGYVYMSCTIDVPVLSGGPGVLGLLYLRPVTPAMGLNNSLDLSIFNTGTFVENTSDLVSGATYRIRYRISSGNAQAKIWLASESEPAAWNTYGTGGLASVAGWNFELNVFDGPFPTWEFLETVTISDITFCAMTGGVVAYAGAMYGPVFVATADGTTSLFTLPLYPGNGYVPGTLDARVDGIPQPATETDPDAATFDFGVDPDAGDTISAAWRVPS